MRPTPPHRHPRLLLSLLIGLVIGLALPTQWRVMTRVLVSWNVGVWAYLLLMGWLMVHADQQRAQQIAEREDRNAVAVLTILSVGAALSLFAIVLELVSAKQVSGSLRIVHYAFTAATVASAWALVMVTYTFHYAHVFYTAAPTQRPLRFPDNERNPDYWDFLYVAVTIAVAAQTSDVEVLTREMRKAVIAQSILSFLFNAAIIGLSINIAAGLIGT